MMARFVALDKPVVLVAFVVAESADDCAALPPPHAVSEREASRRAAKSEALAPDKFIYLQFMNYAVPTNIYGRNT